MKYNKDEIRKEYIDLFEHALDLLFVVDLNGNFIDANDIFLKTFGYDHQDLQQLTIKDILDEEQLKIASKGIREFATVGLQSNFTEYKAKTKAGDILYFATYGIPLKKNGKVYAILVNANNITKLKLTEQKYHFLFETSPSGILLRDYKGIVLDVNPALENIIGYKKEELVGINYLKPNIILPQYFPILQERLNKLLNGETVPFMDAELRRKDGKIIWVKFLSSLFQVGDQRFIQSIIHEITDIKLTEMKLKESEIKYRLAYDRAEFYKDLFAHDMNNILQSILSSVELYTYYLIYPEKEEKSEELLSIIKDQTIRGSNLISNIQKLSKIEESQIGLEKLELNFFLTEAFKNIKNSYQDRNIIINSDISNEKYYVQANNLLIDVINNILSNAVKYNLNSSVEINVKISKEQKEKTNYIKIQFIDNGLGIPDSRKETIFQRGYNQERSIRGMGLGLSLVSIILNSYHGHIMVEDKVKDDYTQGSNFIVYIPEAP